MESGNVLVVKDTLFGRINVFVIEKVGSQGITLALNTNPYQRLTIDKDSVVFKAGPVGVNNLFNVDQTSVNSDGGDSTQLWTISANGSKKEGELNRRYLCNDKNGIWKVCISPMNSCPELSFRFYMKVLLCGLDGGDYSQCFNVVQSIRLCPLRHWQMQRFVNEGYMHLPRIVDACTISECVRYLNHHLGIPGSIVAGGVQTGEALGKFDGHLSNCAAVRAVFRQTERMLDVLLGVGGYENANVSGQIAFRFPELNTLELTESNRDEIASSTAWHTDGLRQGKSHPFSVLLGVVLSDIETEFSGNLMVWPGSHQLLHQCKTSEYGALDEIKLSQLVQQLKYSDCRGVPTVRVKHTPQYATASVDATTDQHHDNEPELPSLGCPYQITAKAGDILLLHPDLAHAGGPNYSNDIRQIIYYRIKSKQASWESLVALHNKDMWVDLPGVRKILGEVEL